MFENAGPEGNVLSEREFRKLLLDKDKSSPEELLRSIVETGQRIWRNHEADDDCTVLVYQWLDT